MFKQHRQNCEHPKTAQFDIFICNMYIHAITSDFFNKFQWSFGKKFDNYVTDSTTKKNHENQSYMLKRIDRKVTLLIRYQFSCFIKDFSYSEARILLFINIWSQQCHQTREVTLFKEKYRITK